MYAYLDAKFASERKPGMTDEQFHYKTRKNAIGPFKAQIWALPESFKEEMGQIWESQFSRLFEALCLKGTRKYVDAHIHPVIIHLNYKAYLGEASGIEDVSDLAD